MLLKHEEQRVVILIDIQNMYHSAKNLYNANVNFKEVVEAGLAGRKLIRTIGYTVETEGEEEKTFFKALRKMGIEVKLKDLQVFPGGMKKGDWDVGIAVDAIKFSNYVDSIVIISGDGDFIPLVKFLKSATPVRVELMAFGKSCSNELSNLVDDFIDLSKSKKFLLK